jgi:hypothetical protein
MGIDATFKPGDPVEITTIDRGRRGLTVSSKRKPKVQVWRAAVIGPSVLGTYFWLVKSEGGPTYTVPAAEMRSLKLSHRRT